MNNYISIPAYTIWNSFDQSDLKRNAEPRLQYEPNRRVSTNPSFATVCDFVKNSIHFKVNDSMNLSNCDDHSSFAAQSFLRDTNLTNACGTSFVGTTTVAFFDVRLVH